MMREIRISDLTVGGYSSGDKSTLTFREKIEVAKLLEKLGVSVIELGNLTGEMADLLLIKSVASSVKEITVAVCPGFSPEAVSAVWDALKGAEHPRLQVCAAVSTARMEYVYHKKADDMIRTAVDAVRACVKVCSDVEFLAEDATRADLDYLSKMLEEVITAGATTVTICDTAGAMLPDEFGAFLNTLYEKVPALRNVAVGICCSDALGVATATEVAAIRAGISEIKVSALSSNGGSLREIAKLLSEKGSDLGVGTQVRTTELNRVLQSIERLCNKTNGRIKSPFEDGVREYPKDMAFTRNDGMEEIVKGAAFLGYDLNDDDRVRIWNAFCEVAKRKDRVSIGELEAIIASEAMQVPPTYTLENYVVTTGNKIDISAHVKLKKGEEIFDGLSLGDGPIDAAFLAIEKIIGHHYELDDFQIQAITEGREAMGQTVVRLRAGGKVYSGKGISTDIIGAGVAAYVNALNKILYEEENA